MTRKLWLNYMYKIINPIFDNFKNGNIINIFPTDKYKFNIEYVELMSRIIYGISTWFNVDESMEEKENQNIIFNNCKTFIYFLFNTIQSIEHKQLIVEYALLCASFLRTKKLWYDIEYKTKENILNKLIKTNNLKKYEQLENNWILFKCMIEIFLYKNKLIENLDECIDNLKRFELLYVGDGWYKDGNTFKMDYYNSFIIYPFLYDIYNELVNLKFNFKNEFEMLKIKMQRYMQFLERMISPEGTFPIFGRSAVYRTGAFSTLSYGIYVDLKPKNLELGQIKAGLTKVIQNVFIDKNFDEKGILKLGFMDEQKKIVDVYSNHGSLYFCLTIFSLLGLDANNEFWISELKDWTQKKLWNGDEVEKDESIS